MAKITLLPITKDPEIFYSYLEQNFKRLATYIENSKVVESGVAVVTGALVVDTNLSVIDAVVASLVTDPTSTGCFVRASAVGSTVSLRVLTNAFAQSTVAKSVAWIAVGE